MRAIKKRPASVEILYFDFSRRLVAGETLNGVDAQPTMVLPSDDNTDLSFTTLEVNAAVLTPPSPSAPIAIGKGVSATVSGGLLPEDVTAQTAILPDGTIGTVYEYSFSVTTTNLRTINEQYQLWISNDDYPAYWTSHWELNRRYAASAINQWADVENEGDQNFMLGNIWAAVGEATDEMRSRLRGSPCGLITPDVAKQSMSLRRHATMLAASILYRARGVRDTSDEEGRDRFSSDVKRVDKYIQRIRANQIRLLDGDVGVTTHPFVLVDQSPYLSPIGPLMTPTQTLKANQWSELQGIPSYNAWFNSYDTFWWGWP